jgi:tetratricopeptide (TPR) repeat protein
MKIRSLFLLIAVAGSYLVGERTCPQLAEHYEANLYLAVSMKIPEGRLKQIREEITSDRKLLPECEGLAYLQVRTEEMLAEIQKTVPDDQRKSQLTETLARFPKSAKIATVVARSLGTVDAARQAVDLDPSYAPARVALAKALLKHGNPKEALAVMEAATGIEYLPDGYLTLALVRSANGDENGAIRAAKQELKGRKGPCIEPGFDEFNEMAQADELLGLTYLKQKRYSLAAPHLLAAAPYSEKAKALVDHPDPPLRKALAKARHSRH